MRHGNDRGPKRLAGCMAPALEYIELKKPELHRQLQFHQTGEPLPSLDGIGSVVFWLAGPLNNYPSCYEDAVRIAEEARERGLTLINPPEALHDLSKARQSRVWQDAGIPCSPVETFEDLEDTSFDLIVTLSPEAHHRALEWTRHMAAEVEYWPTFDATAVEGDRERRLEVYREVRDSLIKRIQERFPAMLKPD